MCPRAFVYVHSSHISLASHTHTRYVAHASMWASIMSSTKWMFRENGSENRPTSMTFERDWSHHQILRLNGYEYLCYAFSLAFCISRMFHDHAVTVNRTRPSNVHTITFHHRTTLPVRITSFILDSNNNSKFIISQDSMRQKNARKITTKTYNYVMIMSNNTYTIHNEMRVNQREREREGREKGRERASG